MEDGQLNETLPDRIFFIKSALFKGIIVNLPTVFILIRLWAEEKTDIQSIALWKLRI